jgi:hypothetical protein
VARGIEIEEKTGKKQRGREPQIPAPEQAQPDAKAQRNFTDPESRIMPDGPTREASCRATTHRWQWMQRHK